MGHPLEEFHNNQRSSDALILATIQKTIEERRASKPIFAAAYLESTHFPYYQLGEDQRLFDVALSPNKLNFTSYPESYTSDAYKLYLNTLHSLDYELGQFIKFLNDQNILKDSIIVVTGDHGQAFHEKGFVGHSTPLVWEVINVPLIFFDGSKRHSMRLWSESVSHIDIAPSLLELLNLPATTLFQGRSLFRPSLCESPVVSANLLLNDFAVIYNELKYRVNSRTGKECLSLGEAVALCGPFEGELLNAANSFSDYLSLFLSTQFAYYDAPKAFREKHAPPAIPCLSTASREAILNSRLHLSETVTSSSFRYEPGKAREG